MYITVHIVNISVRFVYILANTKLIYSSVFCLVCLYTECIFDCCRVCINIYAVRKVNRKLFTRQKVFQKRNSINHCSFSRTVLAIQPHNACSIIFTGIVKAKCSVYHVLEIRYHYLFNSYEMLFHKDSLLFVISL